MARRQKPSAAGDLMDAVAKLPWWVGVLLAAVFYFILHGFASRPVVAPTNTAQVSGMVIATFIRGLAQIGQYLLPVLCLAGAGMSAFKRHQRQGLVEAVADSGTSGALLDMSWQEFEMLVSEAFRLQGYRVEERGGAGADGGIDLVLWKNKETFLVQCKQWRAVKVGVQVVRELYGVMAAEGSAGGFVITSGRFTVEAKEFAKGRNVTLMDGPVLHAMIREAKAVKPVPVQSRPQAQAAGMPLGQPSSLQPTCPLCSSAMVKRVAKQGKNAGSSFWGCAAYPKCKGTKTIASTAGI